MRSFIAGRKGNVIEEALVLPLVLILTFGLITLAQAGYVATTAATAANAAARVAAVSQENPVGKGRSEADAILHSAVGHYHVAVTADSNPGGQVTVRVRWSSTNFVSGFGLGGPITGVAQATRYKEGW